ncbi:MAG: hypothetical protein OEV17_05760 [Nitrospira sp.]|nr:hypothetical protein [Nitrospira sp.]
MWIYLWKTGFRWRAPALLILVVALNGCAAGRYTPLSEAENDAVEPIKENVYRVEYRVGAFTSQEQLDLYLRRRCPELTVREGYHLFHLAQRTDVLGLLRRTAMTVTMLKGHKPVGTTDLHDAKEVLAETATAPKTRGD